MQILIVNGYVRENKGDAALMSVLSRQLRDTFKGANILIASMEDPDKYPDFEGFKTVGSMHLYAMGEGLWRPYKMSRKLFTWMIAAVWPILPFHKKLVQFLPHSMQGEMRAIENADLVVSMSGGYIIGTKSLTGNLNILFHILPLRLAERLNKMVVLAPQSFGPFVNPWQRRVVFKTLNDAALVCVREDKSYTLLKTLGIKEDRMIRTIDSGFAHIGRKVMSHENKPDKILVGITARNWLPKNQQKAYEEALAGFIVDVEKNYNAKTVLIPQVTSAHSGDDDRVVEARIKNLAVEAGANPIQITDEMDHYDIKDLYSGFTFTVGTRFHSVIFSLTSYVPAIAIEYEHKTSGIMHDLQLEKWVIKIEDVTTEKLNSLFSKLMVDQEAYRQHLHKVLPPYVEQVSQVTHLIKQVYERRVGSDSTL